MKFGINPWGKGQEIIHLIGRGIPQYPIKGFSGSSAGRGKTAANNPNLLRDKEKNQRRRRILQKNTSSIASLGYLLPWTAYLITKIFNLSTYSYWDLTIIGLWILISHFVFQYMIHRKLILTTQFANMITFCQLANWIAIYSYLIIFLNEVRLSALLVAFIGIIFALPNAGFLASLLLSSAVAVSYTSISYYQIYYGHQKGFSRLN